MSAKDQSKEEMLKRLEQLFQRISRDDTEQFERFKANKEELILKFTEMLEGLEFVLIVTSNKNDLNVCSTCRRERTKAMIKAVAGRLDSAEFVTKKLD